MLRGVDEAENVDLSIGDSQLCVKGDTSFFYTKLIDAPYPSYHQIFPKDTGPRCIVSRAELLSALNQVIALADNSVPQLLLELKDKELAIKNSGEFSATGSVTMAADWTEKDITVKLNGRYLREGLDVMEGGASTSKSGPLPRRSSVRPQRPRDTSMWSCRWLERTSGQGSHSNCPLDVLNARA